MPKTRQTLREYGRQLQRASNILTRHSMQEIHDPHQLALAETWFQQTLTAMIDGKELPEKPDDLLEKIPVSPM